MPLLGLVPPIAFVAALLGFLSTSWLIWSAIVIIVSVLFWAALYRYIRESVGYALLYPLGFVMLFVIAFGGVRRGQRVEWKQRTYLSS
jgi:multidrug transporter EmrE-like cation transporter